MKKRLFFCFAAGLLVFAGFRAAPQMVESSIPSLYYITPNQTTYESTISCTGTLQPAMVQEVYLSGAAVPGQVLVAPGDTVRKGEVLAQIDRQATQELGQQASYSALAGQLSGGLVPGGLEGVDLTSLLSAYGVSSLLGGGIDLEAVLSLLDGQEEGDGANLSAVVSEAEEALTAPLAGLVTEVNIRENVPASGAKAAVTIADTSSYLVVAQVGEGDIGKVQVGDAAKVRGNAFGGRTYGGTVTKIYPTARKAVSGSGTDTVVDVEITLEKPDKYLKPGFSAKVELVAGSFYDMITVPYEAIRQDENNNEYVYTYENGVLHKTNVVTGQELTSQVEILDGIDFDSVVIFNPDDVTREGTMVQIKGRANVD